LTLSVGKTQEAFDRGVIELLVNGGIVVALVLAIFMTRIVDKSPETADSSKARVKTAAKRSAK
jgi:hypothetical protein